MTITISNPNLVLPSTPFIAAGARSESWTVTTNVVSSPQLAVVSIQDTETTVTAGVELKPSETAAPVDYTINFTATSGNAPTSGAFTYDSATPMFTNFFVAWEGRSFDLAIVANFPVMPSPAPACLGGATGAAASFIVLSGGCTTRGYSASIVPSNDSAIAYFALGNSADSAAPQSFISWAVFTTSDGVGSEAKGTFDIQPAASSPQFVVDDLATFVGLTGPNVVATFEDVAIPSTYPFVSGSLEFDEALVLDESVGMDQSFWFAGGASPDNWMGIGDVPVVFPTEAMAFGFNWSLFSNPEQAYFDWQLFSSTGDLLAHGRYVIPQPFSFDDELFFGLISDEPFASVRLNGIRSGTDPQRGGIWYLDDVRIAQ